MNITLQANTQTLLFKKDFTTLSPNHIDIPEEFYSEGFALFNELHSPEEAHRFIQSFIPSIDRSRSAFFSQLLPRTKLAKVDQIPVCKPVVDSSFQALHLDMGQPIVMKGEQSLFNFTALYFPMDQEPSEARTRLISIPKLLAQKSWGKAEEVEERLKTYVEKHGDGWGETNTGRLACLARVIDAMTEQESLTHFRDQHTNEWFDESHEVEKSYYARHGYDLDSMETQIQLRPGQLLIIDNLRSAHGKLGKRNEAEIFQFMYGVEIATPKDVDLFRDFLVQNLTGSTWGGYS